MASGAIVATLVVTVLIILTVTIVIIIITNITAAAIAIIVTLPGMTQSIYPKEWMTKCYS